MFAIPLLFVESLPRSIVISLEFGTTLDANDFLNGTAATPLPLSVLGIP